MNEAQALVSKIDELKQRYDQLIHGELDEIRVALTNIEQAVVSLPDAPAKLYTIPAVFRRSYDENFLSDYLAYILDPDKNGIGSLPLRSFLTAADFDPAGLDLEQVNIEREFTFPGGGRIDILVTSEDGFVLGIENKIFSPEGKNQTISYARSLEQLFPNQELYLIFLGPGKHKPSSELFRHLSYSRLLEIFQRTELIIDENSRSAFYWKDFLLHLEVYIAMAHKLPEVTEKAKLYMDNINMIHDIQKAFEADSQQLYDYLTAKIGSGYEGGWEIERNTGYYLLHKPGWKLKDLFVFFIYRFDREILRKDSVVVSLEVQGYKDMWKKSPLIASFIKAFHNTNPKVAGKLKSAGLLHLPTDRKTYIASKTYRFAQDPASIDVAFSKAISDFAFLVDPVDHTIETFKP